MLIFIVIFVNNYPLVQVSLFLFFEITYVLYTIIIRPYSKKKIFVTILINETFVFVIFLSTFILAIYDAKKNFNNITFRKVLGYIIIGSNLGLTLFLVIMVVYDLFLMIFKAVVEIIKYFKSKKNKKSQE